MNTLLHNIPLIFEEGPIARSYLHLIKKYKTNDIKVFYLLNYNFFFKSIYYTVKYKKNLQYPIKFLKDKKIIYLIREFQEYFNFEKNFLFEVYDNNNLLNKNEFTFINSENINSDNFNDALLNCDANIFINTSKQIYKNFNHGKKILHIHPGFIPKVKGADGSLVSILNYNELGVTSFFISKEIDNGEIIKREIFPIKKFKFDIREYNIKDIYRIWFSFFDPLLRCYHLRKLILENTLIQPHKKSTSFLAEKSNYFSFLNSRDCDLVFQKIFYN